MCTPIGKYTGDIDKLQTKTKDFKAMANFVILIKVLIG